MSSAALVCGGLLPRLRLDVAQVCGGTRLQVFQFVPVAGGRLKGRGCVSDRWLRECHGEGGGDGVYVGAGHRCEFVDVMRRVLAQEELVMRFCSAD